MTDRSVVDHGEGETYRASEYTEDEISLGDHPGDYQDDDDSLSLDYVSTAIRIAPVSPSVVFLEKLMKLSIPHSPCHYRPKTHEHSHFTVSLPTL